MSEEISEEAKRAIAENRRRQAFDRLERDGAHSTVAMQRRVKALTQERNIPPADIHKLMYKRPSTPSVIEFCEKYKVNFDWILGGDLQGLQRMARNRQFCDQAVPVAERIMQKFRRLPLEAQKIIEQTVDRLLERQS